MKQVQGVKTFTNFKISGYQLTTALLRGGLSTLSLNNTASLVLLYLASCYNGGVIYPRIKTIAVNVGISEISAKRAIAELVNTNCLMKSKRHNGTNANCYVLTQKILSLYQGDTNQSIKVIPTCMKLNHEKLDKQQADVVLIRKNLTEWAEGEEQSESSTAVLSSSKAHPLNEIPSLIKDNPQIKSPQRYWRSLKPQVREEYLQQQAKIDRKKEAYRKYLEQEEKAKQEQDRKAKEFRKLPLEQQFNRETAMNMVLLATRGGRAIKAGSLSHQLAKLYNIDIKKYGII